MRPDLAPRPRPLLAAAALAALAACAPSAAERVRQPLAPGRSWAATEHRDHPLVGKIWDVRAGRFADAAALQADAARARVVILGETHDNPDHHLLQAHVLRGLTGAGRRPAVLFEMLTREQQPALDAVLGRDAPRARAVAAAVEWDRSGWPRFELYAPIFDAALDARLPIVGANLPRKQIREVVKAGAGALPPPIAARIDRRGPPGPAELEALRIEMQDSHCGELPESLLEPMILAQRARDASMAEAIAAALAGSEAAVLVTGAQHARRDRGVPAFLGEDVAPPDVLSVAFREVDPEAREPAAYGDDDGTLPHDYVVFTPGAAREDPCLQLRRHSPRRRHEEAAAPGAAAPAPAPTTPAAPAGDAPAPP